MLVRLHRPSAPASRRVHLARRTALAQSSLLSRTPTRGRHLPASSARRAHQQLATASDSWLYLVRLHRTACMHPFDAIVVLAIISLASRTDARGAAGNAAVLLLRRSAPSTLLRTQAEPLVARQPHRRLFDPQNETASKSRATARAPRSVCEADSKSAFRLERDCVRTHILPPDPTSLRRQKAKRDGKAEDLLPRTKGEVFRRERA